jgi:hypothetical protein
VIEETPDFKEIHNAVELERVRYNAYVAENPEYELVSDPVKTPFIQAMKTLGFLPLLTAQSTQILTECNHKYCKQGYATLYQKNGISYWGCPHCLRVSVCNLKAEEKQNKAA